MSDNNQLLDRLQSIVNRAESFDTPRSFFLTLFEFVDIYDKDERLNPVMRAIAKLKEKDLKHENELAEAAKKEMRQTYEKLKEQKDNPKFQQIRFFQEGLQHFEAYEKENGSIESTAGPIAGRHGCIIHAIGSVPLDDLDLKKFVSQFGQLDLQGNIINWNFSPSYQLWDAEEKYVQRLLPTKVWHSWDKLVSFYGVFRDFEKIRDDKVKKGQVFEGIGLSMMFQELNDVMSYKQDHKRYLRQFDVGEYKIHLQRVFDYTKDIISEGVKLFPTAAVVNSYCLDENNAVLQINGQSLKLKTDSRKFRILKLLTKKRNWLYYSEVVQEIDGAADAIKDPRNTYYEVCRGMSNSLLKIGVTDFLQYDFNHARINPIYKKIKNR